jgi:DNA-3-methyladenine glycosylase II
MIQTFNCHIYHDVCDKLADIDADLGDIIAQYGYPPLSSRGNTFESLVHIILEQQVSLASALAALNKLREQVPEVTPAGILMLTDDELKACYFSKQKAGYTKYLAEALLSGRVNLKAFEQMPDNEIRQQMTALKGIGNWTVDVYLMFVLQRADIFPVGDLAAVNALKRVKQISMDADKEALIQIAQQWQPYRTVATMLLWHYYLSAPRKPQSK